MTTSPAAPAPPAADRRLHQTVRAMRAQAASHAVAADLASAGIPVMVLKGPDLQARLYGTPAHYPSGDVDLLVPRRDGARAREILRQDGWIFEAENGVLWRLSRAATLSKDGVRIDLHWGLHAAHLASPTLARFERALWDTATRRDDGMFEPSADALLVYLALHAAGHGFERSTWVDNVRAAAEQVRDWDAAWRLASAVGLEQTLRTALAVADGAPPPPPGPIVDGWQGRVGWTLSWVGRGHALPRPIRGAAAAALAKLPLAERVPRRAAGVHEPSEESR